MDNNSSYKNLTDYVQHRKVISLNKVARIKVKPTDTFADIYRKINSERTM